MPKIDIPLRNAEDIKELRKNRRAMRELEELITLSDEVKMMSDRLSELRLSVHDRLKDILDEYEKSVMHMGHRVTIVEGTPRKSLDKEKLLKLIPAAKLEKCYTLGDPPRPTVTVNRVDQITEEKRIAAKVGRALRHGNVDGE